jgi:hypothetical protein
MDSKIRIKISSKRPSDAVGPRRFRLYERRTVDTIEAVQAYLDTLYKSYTGWEFHVEIDWIRGGAQ